MRGRFAFIDAAADGQTGDDHHDNGGQTRPIAQCHREAEHMQAHTGGSFDQTAIRIRPAAHQQQPVLQNHGNDFRIQFAQDRRAFRTPPLVDLAVAFPQLPQAFDLPARPRQDERFRHRQQVDGHIRDQQRPGG